MFIASLFETRSVFCSRNGDYSGLCSGLFTFILLSCAKNENNERAVDVDAPRCCVCCRKSLCEQKGSRIERVASMVKVDDQMKMVPGKLRDAVAFGYFDEAINKTGDSPWRS